MRKLFLAVCIVLISTHLPFNARAAEMLLGDAAKGKKLHDAKCAACHQQLYSGDGSGIYTRDDRNIHTIEGLIGQVNGCNQRVNAHLSGDDVNDVVKYLNETYYKF
ncbi:MAG TPA: c-type cytochrome [Acidiferrobacterales bacterium]|nr:c-type cytochrome [Acidiferrobacterales bacterium]